MATGFIYSDKFLEHDTGAGHPERPDRLRAIVKQLHDSGMWNKLEHLPFSPATEDWVLKVHTHRHVSFVKSSVHAGHTVLDEGDTHVSKNSFDVALLAIGGVLAAVDAVTTGAMQNAFCAVRPPGHHAEHDKVMGFCLFNNVAIAARYAQAKHGIHRIAIIDWDVHHGNGTQEIFYSDESVLYTSTHQYPYYPGTGAREERGKGKGEGFTLNIPMSAGSGEPEYLKAFTEEV
ncbi:MAG TPA: histone deacetylase, partial [Bacteroidota bacterium]|nr:histone deacetylase [Bacteroidota bacterium]